MRYVWFGDNALAKRCRQWLAERAQRPVATFTDIIHDRGALAALQPEFGMAIGYRHILRPDHLAACGAGIINLHTGYLPFNRGAYPNVWPLIDGTPAGVTLHWMDAGLDTGPIIVRREVPVHQMDTAGTLYQRLEDTAFDLFTATWPTLRELPSTPQVEPGTKHHSSELAALDVPDLDATVTWRDALNRLRARTCPPHDGLRVVDRRTRQSMRVRVELEVSG